jgi:4-amino-4-deoxy-L-arabinose transferase-like glycosyltransferase
MRKNQWSWRLVIPVVVLFLLYFASRLFRLTLLPMFVDEASHLSWALQMGQTGLLSEAGDSGKFLIIWLMGLVLPSFGDHVLWLGRFISVGFGLLGLVGGYSLGRRLFDHRVGLIGAGLYLVAPYTFFYTRMALVDGPLTTLVIYLVLVSLRFAQRPNLKYSLGVGVLLMLVILTKLNGFVQGVLPLLVMISCLPRLKWSVAWKWLLVAYSLAALGFIPSLMNFSSHWGLTWAKFGVTEPGQSLGWNWLPNASNMLQFLAQNLSLPVFTLVCVGVVLVFIRRQRQVWLMVGCAGVTLALFVFTPKPWTWFPRYLLPAVPFLLLIAGQFISLAINWFKPYLTRLTWRYVVLTALVLGTTGPALWFDYWLLADPAQAPFVEIDQRQFISGTSAGYGLLEASRYLRSQLSSTKYIVVVYAQRPTALALVTQVYLHDQRERMAHLTIDFATADPDLLAQRLQTQSAPVFIIAPDPSDTTGARIDLDTWPYIQRVAHFDRPGGSTGVNIYQKTQLP